MAISLSLLSWDLLSYYTIHFPNDSPYHMLKYNLIASYLLAAKSWWCAGDRKGANREDWPGTASWPLGELLQIVLPRSAHGLADGRIVSPRSAHGLADGRIVSPSPASAPLVSLAGRRIVSEELVPRIIADSPPRPCRALVSATSDVIHACQNHNLPQINAPLLFYSIYNNLQHKRFFLKRHNCLFVVFFCPFAVLPVCSLCFCLFANPHFFVEHVGYSKFAYFYLNYIVL